MQHKKSGPVSNPGDPKASERQAARPAGSKKSLQASESVLRQELMQQMQYLGQLSSTETAMFHQAAAAKYGLGITDMKTISTLLQEGPMTAGQLTQRLHLTTGAVTSVIDRLEKRNLASRSADPLDRRKVIVTINRTELSVGENVYLSMGQAFEKLLESYSTQELQFLIQHFKASIEMTRQEIAKLSRAGSTHSDQVESK